MANKLQALKWLWKGYRIKLLGWTEYNFLVLTPAEKIINQQGNFVDINMFDGEWSLYKTDKVILSMKLSKEQCKAIEVLCVIRGLNKSEVGVLIGKKAHFLANVCSGKHGIQEEYFNKMCDVLGVNAGIMNKPDVTVKELL